MKRLGRAVALLTAFVVALAFVSHHLPGVVEHNRAHGIDASALFYTESELALRAIRSRAPRDD